MQNKLKLTFILIILSLPLPYSKSWGQIVQHSQEEAFEKMTKKRNPYNLPIIDNMEKYREAVRRNGKIELVDLQEYIPNIKLDIRYATKNNFTRTQVYTQPKAYLVKPAAKALKKAQKKINKIGIGFVIYDAYRPYAATFYFREVYHDTTFVASPTTGSIHNRGCAVDLSFVDLATGEYLTMPTEFDNFTEMAASDYMNLPDEAINNRQLLIETMARYGFSVNSDEWWHYNFKNKSSFPLMDLSFEELQEK